MRFPLVLLPLGLSLSLSLPCHSAAPTDPIPLWPHHPPGEPQSLDQAERDTTRPTDGLIDGQPVIRLGYVSHPTLTLHRPPPDRDTGATVLVSPGGGYHILALDLEGTEVCAWLNQLGVTGALLKYRVPARPDRARHAAPLEDAQRAMALLRHHGPDWGLDPKRIGALGFSAGGHLTAALAQAPQRTYARIDEADDQSLRPDFAVIVYPGYLSLKDEQNRIPAEVAPSAQTPPTFLVMAQDDPVGVGNVLHYALALQAQKAPFELHVYPQGGHGYGLRRTDNPVTTWPDRVADWMRFQGWLKQP